MDDQENDQPERAEWPSVDLAYGIVAPSYDWIQARFDSVERRIQTFLGFTATLTLGLPALVIAVENDADVTSWWFIAAMTTAVLTLAIGIAAKLVSGATGIWFLSPANLYERWLHYSEWEFKKNAIYWAGRHFEANVSRINTMGWLLTGMTFLFALEVIFLLVWAITSLT